MTNTSGEETPVNVKPSFEDLLLGAALKTRAGYRLLKRMRERERKKSQTMKGDSNENRI